MDPSTPRDGSSPKPFEQDTSVLKDNGPPCGKTAQSGALDCQAEMAKSLAAGIPTCGPGGAMSFTVHQGELHYPLSRYVGPSLTLLSGARAQ